uniref:NADH-ubiquinone oxidoreductase chain 4L n=1 Tax=Histeroidea sp. 4 KM-2017 TaxID=2219437 RepID=A0A346RHU0_9COLE|nr:NADH dehydrogenase subunit 4L [Histeroidea sp. 4 KM-2017]
MLVYFFMVMYFIGVISFSLKRKHLLLMLLILEFLVLSLYFGLMMWANLLGFNLYLGMLFLTMSVCEGVMGLSILVSLIRSHGNDYFMNYNILW